jgi:hypothetical protein
MNIHGQPAQDRKLYYHCSGSSDLYTKIKDPNRTIFSVYKRYLMYLGLGITCMQCCGSRMFIQDPDPDPKIFHYGSNFFYNPGSYIKRGMKN